ncbi:tyrosine-type recombinase/integrase [Microbaculum sp. FT89]|uniref:tyrosine-type recombinase/integrase n=1 Tax=Microbaculum sp. FT89 TaxID=3447298 RepID=UPI003F52F674
MPTARLTKRVVDGLQPDDKPYITYDVDLKGFGVRILPSGVKSWVVEYRPGVGRGVAKKRMTIGSVATLTADEARNAARDILASVRLGSDPLGERAKARDAATVSDLIDQFLSDHVEPKRKPKTAELYRHVLNAYVRPVVGKRKAVDVTKANIAKLHHDLRDRPYLANRTIAVVGSMYSWAGKRGLIPDNYNPANKVEKFKEDRRERFLSVEELERLGAAIREAESVGIEWTVDESKPTAKHASKPGNRRVVISPHVAAAFRLLLFTGARLREILHLRWEWVDMERGLLLLPDSKSGRKAIVLSAPAVQILSELPRVGDYVIAGDRADKPRSDLKRPWAAIQRRAGLDGVRLHDLRHTYASVGAGSGLGLPVIGKLLGHTQVSTTQRYAHLDNDPLKRATDTIGATIATALGDGTASGNVVGLKNAKR